MHRTVQINTQSFLNLVGGNVGDPINQTPVSILVT